MEDHGSRHRLGREEVEPSTHVDSPHHRHQAAHAKETDFRWKSFEPGLQALLTIRRQSADGGGQRTDEGAVVRGPGQAVVPAARGEELALPHGVPDLRRCVTG